MALNYCEKWKKSFIPLINVGAEQGMPRIKEKGFIRQMSTKDKKDDRLIRKRRPQRVF
jgi:hypothetical protein